MTSKEIRKVINKLGPWYQRYKMGGIYTTDNMISGEPIWEDIRDLMKDDLYNAKILDIGSNAAYYSMMLALEGAIVVGIEPNPLYFKQGKWTKYYFEQKYKLKFPVMLFNKTASELNLLGVDINYYDYILAISVIYHIGNQFGGAYSPGAMKEQKRVISQLCQMTDRIIVRTRNNRVENSISYYNNIFLENEFYMLKKIIRKRPLLLYGRLVDK